MTLSQASYKGFNLEWTWDFNGNKYYEFSRKISGVQIVSRDRIPRELYPVKFQIIIKDSGDGVFRLMNKPMLMGHPEKRWHPHVNGAGSVCWGEGGYKLCYEHKSLKTLLQKNLQIAHGLLPDFMHGGYHSPSDVIDEYSKIIIPKGRRGVKGVKPLSDGFWTRSSEAPVMGRDSRSTREVIEEMRRRGLELPIEARPTQVTPVQIAGTTDRLPESFWDESAPREIRAEEAPEPARTPRRREIELQIYNDSEILELNLER